MFFPQLLDSKVYIQLKVYSLSSYIFKPDDIKITFCSWKSSDNCPLMVTERLENFSDVASLLAQKLLKITVINTFEVFYKYFYQWYISHLKQRSAFNTHCKKKKLGGIFFIYFVEKCTTSLKTILSDRVSCWFFSSKPNSTYCMLKMFLIIITLNFCKNIVLAGPK